jgi:hypothetical protein
MTMMQETERPAVQGAKVREHLPSHGVVAEFPDMQTARLAIEALGKAGIEGDNISLTGPAAEQTDSPHQMDMRRTTREIDSRMTKHMLSMIGTWTLGGVVIGALLGIPLSIGIMVVLGADITLGRILAGVFLTALAAGIIGWLLPHTSYGPQAAPPWELTFTDSAEGRVKVGVHSERPEDMDLAEEALLTHKPFRLYRTGAGTRQ